MLFISKIRSFQLWLRSSKERNTPSGWVTYDGGLLIQFESGIYETNDSEIIDALLKHSERGIMFDVYVNQPPDQTNLQTTGPGFVPTERVWDKDGLRETYVVIPMEQQAPIEQTKVVVIEKIVEKKNKPKVVKKKVIPKKKVAISQDVVVSKEVIIQPEVVETIDPFLAFGHSLSEDERNQRIELGKKNYKCPLCSAWFSSNRYVGAHKRIEHNTIEVI